MKRFVLIFVFLISLQICYAQTDSIRNNLQDFNYLAAYTEANYAAFPSIIKHGYESTYTTLKEEIRDSLKTGAFGINKATCEYAYWFNHNFDAHYYADLPYFWHVCKKRDTPDYAHIMLYNPQFVSKLVNKNTWLIRIPSCDANNQAITFVSDAVNTFLSGKYKNLILDIRGNSGGGDGIWESLIQLMVDHQALNPETYFFRNTYDNCLPGWIKERMKDVEEDKEFVVWAEDNKEDVVIPAHDTKIHISIIIDRKTASAAEAILRVAKNYTNKERVTIYGKENSAGCAYTGNITPLHLPHSRIQVYYPTCISSAFLQNNTNNSASGIAPDVRIDLPYPQQLTDNIDSWVLWVSKQNK